MTITKKEMSALVAAGRLEEAFTHLIDGVETTYHVGQMREYAKKMLKPFLVPVGQEYVDDVRARRESDPERINDPTLDVDDPILMVMYPPEPYSNGQPVFMLVDGIHRLLRRWDVLGKKDVPAYIFHPTECIVVRNKIVLKDVWGEKNFERNAAERINKEAK